MNLIRQGGLFRFFKNGKRPYDSYDFAWIKFGLRGLQLYVETPSDWHWHKHKRIWFHWSLGFVSGGFSFNWYGKVVPDDGQCSGPRYGFKFFADIMWIYYGKSYSNYNKSKTINIYMPWHWKHNNKAFVEHKDKTSIHLYTYVQKNGEVQNRTATIYPDYRKWTRYWIPWKLERNSICIEFNDEVGERSGTWKGGCTGCSYEMKAGEKPVDTLRRMEIEREFK